MIQRAAYAVGSAVRGLRSSPVSSGVAIATIAATLLLVGSFSLLLANMQRLVDRFGADLKLAVYLAPDLGEEDRDALAGHLLSLPEVEAVVFVSQEEALARFREGVARRTGILDGLDENPLPASFELTLRPGRRNARGLERLAARVTDLAGVDDVGAGAEWVEGYARALGLVRTAGLTLGAALGLAALLIVANTIRLALYARRDEIEILRLVGASPAFVAAPFLIEGLLQGAGGGLIALLVLFGLYQLMQPVLAQGLSFLLGYVEPVFLGEGALALLLLGGAAVGLLGAFLAVAQRRAP